jgi:hypothetical protein
LISQIKRVKQHLNHSGKGFQRNKKSTLKIRRGKWKKRNIEQRQQNES